jgi:hypothetical protein
LLKLQCFAQWNLSIFVMKKITVAVDAITVMAGGEASGTLIILLCRIQPIRWYDWKFHL